MASSAATSETLSNHTVTPGRQKRVPTGQGNGPRPALTRAALGRAISSFPLGRGISKTKRFKVTRDNIQVALTKPSIRRLARQGGVRRISCTVYDATRTALKSYLSTLMADIVAITNHCKRNTVTVGDVCYALKRQGRPIWGFEGMTQNKSKAKVTKED